VSKLIRNYQVSHIFGRTRNVYAFTAPWNIAYVPKIIDPFTGHEATGQLINEYKIQFQNQSYTRFKTMIDEFNKIMGELLYKVDGYLMELEKLEKNIPSKNINELKKSIKDEFKQINI
jgi:hypothetical protein